MSAADAVAVRWEQQEQRERALRHLLERPNMPPRHRTVVLLVAELVTRQGCTWEGFALLVGVSLPTARAYLLELRRWGVLEERDGRDDKPGQLRLVAS